MMKILAIETSCDETAAAVVEVKRQSNRLSVIDTSILSNVIASQIDIHKKYGGVFPEQASRAHTEKIIPVIEEALLSARGKSNQLSDIGVNSNIPITDNHILNTIDLVAVTTGPGLIGSLLVGVNAAKTLAYAKNKPIIGINHWLGHIYSNWANKPFPMFPALVLIVSGGHTGLVLMKNHAEIITLGETLDDAAGEAFDKVAKLLDLEYPGGPSISKAAAKGDLKAFNFPRSMTNRNDYNFSFSGLKTAVLNQTRKLGKLTSKNKNDIAASFQQAVIDILVNKSERASYEYKPKSVCLCGGVSANKELRKQMQEMVEKLPWKTTYHIPDFTLSTDNAAMIGIAAAYQAKSKWTTFDQINADSSQKL